ncbi:hypothetical protein ACQ4M4_02540 [Leptolyngbya sp. AN02str]|uniref:hypothetical protein n=1 Tax=Leptolyngbya sp. AN02str TaxID=3423363 RepID=UPI003D317478
MRLLLLLAALVVLAIVMLQNSSPAIALVFFGVTTPALPLALWVIGAIAAGAITTIVLAALMGLSTRVTVSRSRRSRGRRLGERAQGPSGAPWNPPDWTRVDESAKPEPRDRKRASQSSSRDDWDQPMVDDWDEWASGTSAARSHSSAPFPDAAPIPDAPSRDRTARPWAEETYESAAYAEAPSYQDKEIWDEWAEEEELIDVDYEVTPSQAASSKPSASRSQPSRPPAEPEAPPRKIVEIQRQPESKSSTGTIYSFSYRRDPLSKDDTNPPPRSPSPPPSSAESATSPNGSPSADSLNRPARDSAKPTSKIEEEPIRVIIPPYNQVPSSTTAQPQETPSDRDDDIFSATDLLDEMPFEPSVASNNVASNNVASNNLDMLTDETSDPSPFQFDDRFEEPEVWDDWEEDDSTDEATPHNSPKDNPPLRF